MSSTASNGLKGVYFKNVPEGSEAFELGYRANDVLKEINNTEIKDINSLKIHFDNLVGKSTFKYNIHRLGMLKQIINE
jgi:S1-C subfamily serine protease